MTRARRTRHPAKPQLDSDYLTWLNDVWHGDTRELRQARYLHQQVLLRNAFEGSLFWTSVGSRFDEWVDGYRRETGALLFQSVPTLPRIHHKTWESFVSRTWRQNVHENDRWPDAPAGGWWLPDNWFERANDVIRTRFVVRYMDGVTMLSRWLAEHAAETGVEATEKHRAKEYGYYAMHVLVRQDFAAPALDYAGDQHRSSLIEIQVMTQLAEIVGEFTHVSYEVRREREVDAGPFALAIPDPLTRANDLANLSWALEREVVRLRNELTGPRRKRRA